MPADTGTPDGTTVTQVSQQDGGAPLGAAPASSAAGAADPTDTTLPPREAAQVQQGKVAMIPHAQFARVKQEEFNKGKAAALDEIARAAGYESNADLVTALGRLKSLPAQPADSDEAPAPAKPVAKASPQASGEESLTAEQVAAMRAEKREITRYEKMNEKLVGERNRYAQQAVTFKGQVETLQSQISDLESERELMRTGFEEGLKDVDYAIRLLQQHVARLPPEHVAKFDERAYFKGLRKTHPYLFGETVQPVTTGAGPGGAPPAPKPGQVAAANGANGAVDTRAMSPQQFQEHLRKRGIQPM